MSATMSAMACMRVRGTAGAPRQRGAFARGGRVCGGVSVCSRGPGPVHGPGPRGKSGGCSRRGMIASASGDDGEWGDDWSGDTDVDGVGAPMVEVFDNADAVAAGLCAEVRETAMACIKTRGLFCFGVPGGSVAKALAGLVGPGGSGSSADVDMDWSKVHCFFVNERPEEQKCYTLAMDTWASKVPIPAENVHAVKGGVSLEEAAAAYEAEMRRMADEGVLQSEEETGMPVFDLLLVGMGADGHVGSIYPKSAEVFTLDGRAVLPVDRPGKQSVTMSLELINAADRVVVAATGAGKAATVASCLESEIVDDPKDAGDGALAFGDLPGASIAAWQTLWFLDEDAASKLDTDGMDDDGMVTVGGRQM